MCLGSCETLGSAPRTNDQVIIETSAPNATSRAVTRIFANPAQKPMAVVAGFTESLGAGFNAACRLNERSSRHHRRRELHVLSRELFRYTHIRKSSLTRHAMAEARTRISQAPKNLSEKQSYRNRKTTIDSKYISGCSEGAKPNLGDALPQEMCG